MQIPNKYTVGGQEMQVSIVNALAGKLGTCCVYTGEVKIADTCYGDKQSETSKLNTFYHELVHSILEIMGRVELNEDEVFVSSFSGFLLESLRSFKYDLNETV